jgi:hypothetical protein
MKKFIIAAAFVIAFAANAQAQQKKAKAKTPKSTVTAVVSENEAAYRELLEKANTRMEEGFYREAAQIYSDAMAFDIDLQHTLALRTMANSLAHEYKLVIEDANKYIEGGGGADLAQIYFLRATSWLGLQEDEAACADLKKAKSLGHDVRWEAYVEICGK